MNKTAENKKRGYLVRYVSKDGRMQKGVCYHHEQTPEYTIHKKVFVRLLDDDHSLRLDDHGRSMMAVKNASEVIITGYMD